MPEGFELSDYEEPEVELWPDNEPAIGLYSRVATQWRTGPGGPFGLDYNIVYREMDDQGLSGDSREEMKAAIRVIEAAALRHLRED